MNHKIPDWDAIYHLVNHWSPDVFVVGYPYNIDGTDQKITPFALDFGTELTLRHKRPLYYVDERFTTIEAKTLLFSEGGYSRLKGGVDAYCAKLILEQWFRDST